MDGQGRKARGRKDEGGGNGGRKAEGRGNGGRKAEGRGTDAPDTDQGTVYQQEDQQDVLSSMINAMSPGSRAIAEFKAANARAAGEPAQEPTLPKEPV